MGVSSEIQSHHQSQFEKSTAVDRPQVGSKNEAIATIKHPKLPVRYFAEPLPDQKTDLALIDHKAYSP
ncbi:MAG: hypothetical protein RLZZ298_3146 [Pseudomonadota bacterium]|jgi:hypothetical protein